MSKVNQGRSIQLFPIKTIIATVLGCELGSFELKEEYWFAEFLANDLKMASDPTSALNAFTEAASKEDKLKTWIMAIKPLLVHFEGPARLNMKQISERKDFVQAIQSI